MKSSKNRLVYVYVFLLVALLPVMLLRDVTPSNELRYLSIADEAIANGDLFTFTNQGAPYADKPPLYIWIVMLGKVLFGEHCTLFLALFSFIPAIVIIHTMVKWTRDYLKESQLVTSAFVLAGCGLFAGMAIFLRMDMLMCMFIILALKAFWDGFTNKISLGRCRVLFAIYTFMALFTKGPVGLLVPIVSVIVYLIADKRFKQIKSYFGWQFFTILLVGCALWFGCVYLEGGREYLDNLLFHQTVDRAVDAFTHKKPIWFYLTTTWWCMLPWSLLVLCVIIVSIFKRKVCTPLEKFFFAIIGSTLVMLSAFSSKLTVYLLPAYPIIVYLAFMQLRHYSINKWIKVAIAVPSAIFALACPAMLVLVYGIGSIGILDNIWIIIASAILSVGGVVTILKLYRESSLNSAINYFSIALFAAVFVGGLGMNQMNSYIGYKNICLKAVEVAKENNGSNFYTWNVHRPENMDVYLGADVIKLSDEELLGHKYANGVLIVRESKVEKNVEVKEFLEDYAKYRVGEYFVIPLSR